MPEPGPARVAREDQGTTRRYVLREDGLESELVATLVASGQVSADHTFVPGPLRGRGLARRLLDALLEDARTEGFVVRPRCPFVAAEARRHPEWDEIVEW